MFVAIQIGTFHAYMLYYLRIARIRNGWFLAEILSDITRKKAATPEIGAAVIWLEPKAVYISSASEV